MCTVQNLRNADNLELEWNYTRIRREVKIQNDETYVIVIDYKLEDVICHICVRGGVSIPFDLRLDHENRIATIKDFFISKTGMGIGTHLITEIVEVLREMRYEGLCATIDQKDFGRKDKLIRFYVDHNQFQLIEDLKEDEDGHVYRDLR